MIHYAIQYHFNNWLSLYSSCYLSAFLNENFLIFIYLSVKESSFFYTLDEFLMFLSSSGEMESTNYSLGRPYWSFNYSLAKIHYEMCFVYWSLGCWRRKYLLNIKVISCFFANFANANLQNIIHPLEEILHCCFAKSGCSVWN